MSPGTQHSINEWVPNPFNDSPIEVYYSYEWQSSSKYIVCIEKVGKTWHFKGASSSSVVEKREHPWNVWFFQQFSKHILISFAIHSFIHICIILQIFESTFQLSTNRGALCVQIAHASKAPCIPMKFGNLSIREILMITWPFVCRSIRTTGKPMWNTKLSELVWESITCV